MIMAMRERRRILIIGAAGRDFHNFNVVYRKDKGVEVVAFTAAQIPGIAGRRYPAKLAGRHYPEGIPIEDEKDLEKLIADKRVDECVLSYSDISYEAVMRLASRVLSSGAKFSLLDPKRTMIRSNRPVIAVLAVRTGCGKSQTSRRVVEILRDAGKRVVSVRHPMPYGDLVKQEVQRFKAIRDFKKHNCTIEEMEEYEPHIAMGSVIYAGVDYGKILHRAEKEADVIVWDGGNNDASFYKPDFTIVVADPLRAGDEIRYYPGEVNFRTADLIIINKINSAEKHDIETIVKNAAACNPEAEIIKTASVIQIQNPEIIKNKKVLVVEDGPTLTHGGMKIGAGVVAAKEFGAKELVDPRPFVVGSIKETFGKYPGIGKLLPAIGYGREQMRDLEETINGTECDSVIIATPVDLARFIKIKKPWARVKYDLSEEGKSAIKRLLEKRGFV